MELDKRWLAVAKPTGIALKTITGGRLKGMTDVNPQWRYKAMTETYGLCGIGWKYTVDKKWLEPTVDGIVAAFVDVSLYIKDGDMWSDPIPGSGGSLFVALESGGLHPSDEAFKMATTDALSVAMKMIGVASEVYEGRWDGSKYNESDNCTGSPLPAPRPQPGPRPPLATPQPQKGPTPPQNASGEGPGAFGEDPMPAPEPDDPGPGDADMTADVKPAKEEALTDEQRKKVGLITSLQLHALTAALDKAIAAKKFTKEQWKEFLNTKYRCPAAKSIQAKDFETILSTVVKFPHYVAGKGKGD